MGQHAIADGDTEAAGIKVLLMSGGNTVDDAGNADRIVGSPPQLACSTTPAPTVRSMSVNPKVSNRPSAIPARAKTPTVGDSCRSTLPLTPRASLVAPHEAGVRWCAGQRGEPNGV
jgi:hypothetical protein